MPKAMDLQSELETVLHLVEEDDPNVGRVYSSKIPAHTALRFIQWCMRRNTNPSGAIAQLVAAQLDAEEFGASVVLPKDVAELLHRTAEESGYDTPTMVSVILSDHLTEYAERAATKAKARREAAEGLKGKDKPKRPVGRG